MCCIKPRVSRTVKKKNFVFSTFYTFICLTTEEKARKILHSVCCTANIVVLIILRVCMTRGKKVDITFITNVITIIDIDQNVVIFYLYLIFLRV